MRRRFVPLTAQAPLTDEAAVKERPLTLATCVRIALDENPTLRAAQEGVAAARESVGMAKAPYYPTVGLDAAYRRWETHAFLPEGLSGMGRPSVIGPTDDWSSGLRARYLLFDSGKRAAQLRSRLIQTRPGRGGRSEYPAGYCPGCPSGILQLAVDHGSTNGCRAEQNAGRGSFAVDQGALGGRRGAESGRYSRPGRGCGCKAATCQSRQRGRDSRVEASTPLWDFRWK